MLDQFINTLNDNQLYPKYVQQFSNIAEIGQQHLPWTTIILIHTVDSMWHIPKKMASCGLKTPFVAPYSSLLTIIP